ncbi:TetR-like C-terminal domain-containing protein [Streptomyces sp. PA03-1a]|nr:TetR-like C-terminal domain-containing protein [Streptomyces sp. PA03-1a]MDX2818875.1 TetR-like C-terminal domain-containing protein [Streptomyces sp. PA03-5A]
MSAARGAGARAAGGTDEAPRPGQGRRPAALVRGEVLAAARELLLAEGMAAFTVEKVARRSGASRMTIHKWWPSRGALALDAYVAVVDERLVFEDTGDIEADLTAHMRKFVRHLCGTPAGRVVSELIGCAQTDPPLGELFRERYSGPRRARMAAVLERARDRGQLAADIDPQALIDQLWGACYFRLLVADHPVSEGFAETIVHHLLHGVGGHVTDPA